MFKLKEENKAENLLELTVRVQSLQDIEQIRRFEVAFNSADMPDSNYDVALIFDFETAEDLEAYQNHPSHKAFGAFITQIRENRACIDYRIPQ
jgi:hypothetical protein